MITEDTNKLNQTFFKKIFFQTPWIAFSMNAQLIFVKLTAHYIPASGYDDMIQYKCD